MAENYTGPSRGAGAADEIARKKLTRRQLLTGAAGVAGAVALGGPLLAGCGGSDDSGGGASPSASATAAAKPKKGGQIRSAVSGGSTKDSLDD